MPRSSALKEFIMHYPVLVAPNLKAGWRTGSAPMGGTAAFIESAERLTVLVADDEIDLM